MLILARKEGEAIMIGNEIKIVVLEIKNKQVKLSIDVPKSIPVFREEIYWRLREERED